MQVCKTICKQCPFAKGAIKGWLGNWESPQQLHQFVMAEHPFPCHMKMTRDLSVHEAGTKRFPLCRGGLAYMGKNGKLPRNPELADAIKELGESDYQAVMIVPEFINHHSI